MSCTVSGRGWWLRTDEIKCVSGLPPGGMRRTPGSWWLLFSLEMAASTLWPPICANSSSLFYVPIILTPIFIPECSNDTELPASKLVFQGSNQVKPLPCKRIDCIKFFCLIHLSYKPVYVAHQNVFELDANPDPILIWCKGGFLNCAYFSISVMLGFSLGMHQNFTASRRGLAADLVHGGEPVSQTWLCTVLKPDVLFRFSAWQRTHVTYNECLFLLQLQLFKPQADFTYLAGKVRFR